MAEARPQGFIHPDEILTQMSRGEGLRILTDVTVDLAQFMLGRYAPSRPLNVQTVLQIVQRLADPDQEGEAFEEVRISRSGKTIAGQHLLQAVVRSGRTAGNVTVVFGAPTLMERYVETMSAGPFLSGDPELPDGPILSGQHRLAAMLEQDDEQGGDAR